MWVVLSHRILINFTLIRVWHIKVLQWYLLIVEILHVSLPCLVVSPNVTLAAETIKGFFPGLDFQGPLKPDLIVPLVVL